MTLAGLSLRPDPGAARSWVEQELSRPAYRQSLLDQLVSWLGDLWSSLQAAALDASPLSTGAAVLVLVVLATLLVLVTGRVRFEPHPVPRADAALGGGPVSPEEHRARADAARAGGSHDLAVVEGFRAVAARAVARGVVAERAGRTAHELATELAPLFPQHAAHVQRASTLFDSVLYGEQPVTEADASLVLELDDALRTTRPGLAPPAPAPAAMVRR